MASPENRDEVELRILRESRIDLAGRLPRSSNLTLLGLLSEHESAPPEIDSHLTDAAKLAGLTTRGACIYKPSEGERPLWDFEIGTLCRREVAAYEVSRSLGWNIVPPTVLREGPLGLGSIQRFVAHAPTEHYFTLVAQHEHRFREFALFDVITNNADRKSGHCLLASNGEVIGIDHGTCFNAAPKLRTVIWDFGGEPIPDGLRSDVTRLLDDLETGGRLLDALAGLLEATEVDALVERMRELGELGVYPLPTNDRQVPWPMI